MVVIHFENKLTFKWMKKKKQTLKLKPTYASEPNCTLNYNVIILGEKRELILVTFKPIEK